MLGLAGKFGKCAPNFKFRNCDDFFKLGNYTKFGKQSFLNF